MTTPVPVGAGTFETQRKHGLSDDSCEDGGVEASKATNLTRTTAQGPSLWLLTRLRQGWGRGAGDYIRGGAGLAN